MSLFGRNDAQQIDVHFETDRATIHYTGPAVDPRYIAKLVRHLRNSQADLPKRVVRPPRIGFADAIGQEDGDE